MTGRSLHIILSCIGFAAYLFTAATCRAQELTFSGNSLKAIAITPEKSTGLEKIYVIYDTQGVSAHYTSASGSKVTWSKFGNLGGGHAEEFASSESGNISSAVIGQEDSGYIVKDGDRQYCYWIVNYLPHRLKIDSAGLSSESECGVTLLEVKGTGAPIRYYTINGMQKTLNRDIEVDYRTQEWRETPAYSNFEETNATCSFEYLTETLRITPPNYCATDFTIHGDRFLREWNWETSFTTQTYAPVSVDARTIATQKSNAFDDTASSGSNEIGSGDFDGLGGSAPCDISFSAYVTDGIIHSEWQLSRDSSFENIDYRFTTQDLDYTFLDEGSTYVRYIGSNSDGSCEYISDTYEVNVGASQLLVPNAFSPNGDGVNDEWKVAYKSLVEFRCWIFDRQGHQICALTAPDQGWDGKIGGKTVESGVFYYVIEAVGADGKKYKKSGDINVVKFVGRQGTSSGIGN